jgi:predicted dinucleotide-binding enzyme
MIGCQVGSAEDAAEFGEVVVIAVPLSAIHSLPVAAIKDKHVIDAVNYYPERDGPIEALESGETTTSELLAQILPAATVTKAFNAIPMTQLESDGLPAGAENRRALPLAGDSEKGKAIAAALYEAFGFDTVDAGPLSEGWRFERGQPAYCVRMTRPTLLTTLSRYTASLTAPSADAESVSGASCFSPASALYIPLLADTKHSLKPEKEKLIVISTAPQWG